MHIFRFVNHETLVCQLLGIKPRQLEKMSAKQLLEALYGLDRQITNPNAQDAALQLAGLSMQKATRSGVCATVQKKPALAGHFIGRVDNPTGDWIEMYNWLIAARDGAAIGDEKQT